MNNENHTISMDSFRGVAFSQVLAGGRDGSGHRKRLIARVIPEESRVEFRVKRRKENCKTDDFEMAMLVYNEE